MYNVRANFIVYFKMEVSHTSFIWLMIVLFALADIFRLKVLKDFEGLEDFPNCVSLNNPNWTISL